jgi:hypothetical protein
MNPKLKRTESPGNKINCNEQPHPPKQPEETKKSIFLGTLEFARPMLGHATKPVHEERRDNIEPHVGKQQTDVAPNIRVRHVETLEELVCSRHWANFAIHRGLGIEQFALHSLDVGVQITAASLAIWRRDSEPFNAGTFH